MPAKHKSEREPVVQWGASGQIREIGVMYSWTPDGLTAVDAKAVKGLPSKQEHGCSLGLRFENQASVIEQIKRGFDVVSLTRLSQEIQVTTQQLAEIASIAKRTLARRKREGRLNMLESEKIYRIATLFDRAVQVLGSAEQARLWLKTPKKALREQTPLQHSETEVGAREVEDLLGRLEYGVFS
jgi:putative toxin-antitoxin system antitoxin component (TIGR02293 family)